MSCHGYEGVMQVLCTPFQVKCYRIFHSYSLLFWLCKSSLVTDNDGSIFCFFIFSFFLVWIRRVIWLWFLGRRAGTESWTGVKFLSAGKITFVLVMWFLKSLLCVFFSLEEWWSPAQWMTVTSYMKKSQNWKGFVAPIPPSRCWLSGIWPGHRI